MATSDEHGIPVFYNHDQDGVRLLELSDEILDVVTSGGRILFKSGPADDVTRPAQVVLCTATKTFSVRQVQTSNSVFILKSHPADQDGGAEQSGSLHAVATSTNTIELSQITSTSPDILQSLRSSIRAQLLVYEYDPTATSTTKRGELARLRHQILADVPFSIGECLDQWRQLCAFEQDGYSYVPSNSTLRKVWDVTYTTLTSQGLALTRPFDLHSIEQAMQEDGLPTPLLHAVLENLVNPGAEPSSDTQCPGLDQDRCLLWLGTIVANSSQGSQALAKDTSAFLTAWKTAVPEDWADQITLDFFQRLQTEHAASIAEGRLLAGGSIAANAKDSNSTTKPKVAGKRDWHEKFRKGR